MKRLLSGLILAVLFSTSFSHAMEGNQQEAAPKRPRLRFPKELLKPDSRFCDEIAEPLTLKGYQFSKEDIRAKRYRGGEGSVISKDPRFISFGGESHLLKMHDAQKRTFAVKCTNSVVKITKKEEEQLDGENDGPVKNAAAISQTESIALQLLAGSAHVINCVEHLDSKQGCAVVMPYFSKSLDHVIGEERRALSFTEIDLVAKTLLKALVDASACGPQGIKVVNGDIKPANILIEEQDGKIIEARLADFGTAIFIDPAGNLWHPFAGHEVLDNCFFGTPGWVAPEVALTNCQAKASYGQKIDVWSAFLLIYRMWTKESFLTEGGGDYQSSVGLPSQILGRFSDKMLQHAEALAREHEEILASLEYEEALAKVFMFKPEDLPYLYQDLVRDSIDERQKSLLDYLGDRDFKGRLLGADPAAQEYEMAIFTRFLVQGLDTNPDRRLDPAQALSAWEEVSQAMTARLAAQAQVD